VLDDACAAQVASALDDALFNVDDAALARYFIESIYFTRVHTLLVMLGLLALATLHGLFLSAVSGTVWLLEFVELYVADRCPLQWGIVAPPRCTVPSNKFFTSCMYSQVPKFWIYGSVC
jgi:hypothetical protein